MPYPKAKIYKQGGHFIAIPHTEQPHKERRKAVETEIFVEDPPDETSATTVEIAPLPVEENKASEAETNSQIELIETKPQAEMPKPKRGRITTKRKLFDELYKMYYSEKKRTRRKLILQAMLPYFKTADDAAIFVDKRLRQKQDNFIARRIRMTRKASLTNFNYFVTFTYDGALHTEESFKKKLKKTLSNFAVRKGWRYIGVWERSPEKKRLHFHGMLYVPEDMMPGGFEIQDSYSFSNKRRQKTKESTYFRERFGRNDFEDLNTERALGGAVTYILKYIEKSGEKIIYSRDLPQFIIGDIMENDIASPIGIEDQKMLLYDDFDLYDDGCYIGKPTPENIKLMPKCN